MAESNYQKIDASCLLLQVQGGETSYIRKGEIFTIGRSKKNNLVINDPTVSRFHATIKWEDEFPIIRDNGSTAGLLINGKQVECAQLIIIHLISLGGTKIVAEYSPSEASTPTKTMLPVASSAVLNSLDDIDDVVLFLEHGVDDITGSLNSNKKIHDLLVYLELHKRSGTLTFQGEMNAKIIFTLGKYFM